MKKKNLEEIRCVFREEIAPVLLLLQKPVQEEQWFTREQLLQFLNIGSTKLWQLVKNNEIKHSRVGR